MLRIFFYLGITWSNTFMDVEMKQRITFCFSVCNNASHFSLFRRDSDLLFQSNKVRLYLAHLCVHGISISCQNSKAGKGKKLFGKLSSMKEDSDSDKGTNTHSLKDMHVCSDCTY